MERNLYKGGAFVIDLCNNKKRKTFNLFKEQLYKTINKNNEIEINNIDDIISEYKDKD